MTETRWLPESNHDQLQAQLEERHAISAAGGSHAYGTGTQVAFALQATSEGGESKGLCVAPTVAGLCCGVVVTPGVGERLHRPPLLAWQRRICRSPRPPCRSGKVGRQNTRGRLRRVSTSTTRANEQPQGKKGDKPTPHWQAAEGGTGAVDVV